MSLPNGTLEKFYRVGWEKRWLLQLDKTLTPTNLCFRLRLKKTLALINRSSAAAFRVLDLGCGVGIYDIHLLRQFPAASIFGMDFAESQIQAARELAKEANVAARAHFLVGNANTVGVDGLFDVILCSEVIAHLPDPSPCLNAIRRAASPSTQIIISVPMRFAARHPQVYYRQRVGKNFEAREAENSSAFDQSKEVFSYYYHRYSPMEIKDLLGKHGIGVRREQKSCFQLRDPVGLPKRLANAVNVRARTVWVDNLITGLYGCKNSEVLILDCALDSKSR